MLTFHSRKIKKIKKPKLFPPQLETQKQNEFRPADLYYFVPVIGSPFTSASQNVRPRTQQQTQQPAKQQQQQPQQQQPAKQQPVFSPAPSAAMGTPTGNAASPAPMVT